MSLPAPSEHKHGHYVPDDFPAPIRALATASRALAVFEGVGIGVSLAALVGLALWQLITRNLRMHGFPQVPMAPDWTDNVLRHSVFLIGFLGAMYATYTARHLRVDAITRLGSVSSRLLMRAVATVGALTVCGFVIYAAWQYRKGVLDETTGEGQLFTPSRGALIIVIGLSGMVFHFAVQLLIDVTYLLTGRAVPAFWASEATHGGEEAGLAEDIAEEQGGTATSSPLNPLKAPPAGNRKGR